MKWQMTTLRAVPFVVALALARPAAAYWGDGPEAVGALVGVSVEVDGRTTPLYASPDGSDRRYLEARAGARYAISLANRTPQRLGVVVTVDGLNAISGERDAGIGRMYVLGPWEQTTVRGWRTSLSDVRRFTFVDERSSYAARSGKANAKMGWIEVAVYRECRPYVRRPWYEGWLRERPAEPDARDEAGRSDAPPAAKAAPEVESRSREGARPESYPGTGWGPRADDPVRLVTFEPEPSPAERVSLRYEYASGLRALGIFPRPYWDRDRLRERERGEGGFARPPAW
jgi:hypothetical protein